MSITIGYYLVVVVSAVMCDSVFEWILHRYLMHRPVRFLRFAFKKHTLVHHFIFRADKSYHCGREADKRAIRMAWWIGPVLVAVLLLPVGLITIPLGWWSVLVIFGVVSGMYFFA